MDIDTGGEEGGNDGGGTTPPDANSAIGRGTQTEGYTLERQLLDELCEDVEIISIISERRPEVLQKVMQMKKWEK